MSESYEDRIADIHTQFGGRIGLEKLTDICMDMLTSEFNELEDAVHILFETGNSDGLLELANNLIS